MKITKSELKEMIREALREELAKKHLNEAHSPSGTPEFEITYRFGDGPVNVGYLYADDENEAREFFLDYLADNDEIEYDDDVTILKIKHT